MRPSPVKFYATKLVEGYALETIRRRLAVVSGQIAASAQQGASGLANVPQHKMVHCTKLSLQPGARRRLMISHPFAGAFLDVSSLNFGGTGR